jgi:hypothetical protein
VWQPRRNLEPAPARVHCCDAACLDMPWSVLASGEAITVTDSIRIVWPSERFGDT